MREFKIGQNVCYQRHKAEGRFIVIRLMPQPKGEPRYVIRSEENPSREYTVEAGDLRRVQRARSVSGQKQSPRYSGVIGGSTIPIPNVFISRQPELIFSDICHKKSLLAATEEDRPHTSTRCTAL